MPDAPRSRCSSRPWRVAVSPLGDVGDAARSAPVWRPRGARWGAWFLLLPACGVPPAPATPAVRASGERASAAPPAAHPRRVDAAATGALLVARSSRGLPLEGLLLRVFVDERDQGTPPTLVGELAPGEHVVRVVDFRQRYADYSTTVRLRAGERAEVRPDLVVLRGQVEVELGRSAAGATVHLVTGDVRRSIPLLPIVIEMSPQEDGATTLIARRPGWPDFVYEIDFSDGVAEKEVIIEFEPR